jgi:1-acyl-sn-glycerol-3-phosphate acyltransferase
VRALYLAPLVALETVVLGLVCFFVGLLDRSGSLPHAIIRLWARVVLATCGVRVVVEGEERVPAGPAVFAANHASALDIPILFGHLPSSFRIIHKRSLYLAPVVGWVLWSSGHIGIDRANPFRARHSLARAAERIRGGMSVAVFPEGTRSRDGAVHVFKRGSFVLALNAGVPVVPVSLVGVKPLVPRGVISVRPGTVRLRIHPALPTAGRRVEDAQALADEVRAAVVRGCAEGAA